MNYEYTCAVDLDGVMADFSGRIEELTGQKCETLNKGKLWSTVQKYNDTVAPFFQSLPKMKDADELWTFVRANFSHVFVLTATGWTPKDGADQKIAWVKEHLGSDIVTKVVTSGSLKAQFATPSTILIDDTAKAINPWIAAGGVGVLHTSAANTIRELKLLLAKNPNTTTE